MIHSDAPNVSIDMFVILVQTLPVCTQRLLRRPLSSRQTKKQKSLRKRKKVKPNLKLNQYPFHVIITGKKVKNMPRLPEYLKRGIIDTEKTKTVRHILKSHCLNTVCEAARCPNKSECYAKNTATFLIMGNNCTRNCRFCNITCAKPEILNPEEPKKIADAVSKLNLKYVVITSVTRDDLSDGGAQHFAQVIKEIIIVATIFSPP